MNNIIIILKLLPAIIEAIKTMEALLPDNTPGKTKLDAVLTIITGVEGSMNALLPQLTTTITTLVNLLRSTNVIKTPV